MKLNKLYSESTQELQNIRGAIKLFVSKYDPDILQNPSRHILPKNLAGHIRYVGRKFEKRCPTFVKELYGDFNLLGIIQGFVTVNVNDLAKHILSVFTAAGLVKHPNAGEVFELDYNHSGQFRTHGFEVNPDQSIQVKTLQSGWYLHVGDRHFPIKKAVVVEN